MDEIQFCSGTASCFEYNIVSNISPSLNIVRYDQNKGCTIFSNIMKAYFVKYRYAGEMSWAAATGLGLAISLYSELDV